MPDGLDYTSLTTAELLTISRKVLQELRSRAVLRTANAPAGDYAEYLVQGAYGGTLAPNSEKSWDVLTDDGRKLQVKCRALSRGRGTMLFSPFRSFNFDAAVFVLLSGEDLVVVSATEVPTPTVRSIASFRAHVNGHVVSKRDLDRALALDALDVTSRLREFAQMP
jgi:hypothetical protein